MIVTFGRKVNRYALTVIEAHTEVRGSITSRGTLEIHGRVFGDIQHEGSVLVAGGASCTSNIKATHLEIAGTVQGNVEVEGKLEIRDGGRLNGDSWCTGFVIHAGGVLNGHNRMYRGDAAAESVDSQPASEGPDPEVTVVSMAANEDEEEPKGLLDSLPNGPEFRGTFRPRVTSG